MDRVAEADKKGRISMGVEYAGVRFIVTEEDGRVIFTPAVVIPERELWAHENPKVREAIAEGIADAKAGRLTKDAFDLSEFDGD